MKVKRNYLIILVIIFLINTAYSQQGKLDFAFNTYDDGLQGDGFDATVRTVSLQTDGKLIVGGDYLNYNGAPAAYLSRLFSDGSKDTSFNLGVGFNSKVYCSLIQPDGKIILGGSFLSFNGVSTGRLIRLNPDGSRDASFNTLIGTNTGIVYSSALQADGSLVIVGSFTNYNSILASRVARILPNGNLDTTFATGTGASGLVEEVQIQSDGKIILVGSFASFNGTVCNKIIRLNANGSIDTTFLTGTGFNDTVTALALQSDGKIVVGGVFTTYKGVSANRIIRLNTDGSMDSSFISGTGFSNDGVAIIKIDSAGVVMIGGSFTGTYNGTAVNRLVLLDANGVINPTFDIGTGPASATVYAISNSADGSWFVGGSFSIFDSQNQGRLAKIDSFGILDIGYLTAGVGFSNSVLKVISLPDSKTMAFGSFTKFNGTSAARIARLLESGTLDSSFNSSGIGANNSIRSAAIQPDNKIIFAGSFTNYNGLVANRIARILADGSIDASFTPGTASNGTIYTLALQSDGKIIIAGSFSSYNGTSAIRIARLFSNGTLDTSFNVGSGANDIVETVVLQQDGKIILGGRFAIFNGSPFNRLVRLNTDGSTDFGFSIDTGFDKNVYSVALQSDNKLIVGGAFLNFGGISTKRILRLNTNGSLDTSFTTGTSFSAGEVRTILVQPDDRLLLGGTFTGNYNGISVKRMVRLLSSGLYDSSFLVNLNNTLYNMCFTPDYKLMIGGNFNSVSGIAKHRMARLKLCTNSSIWNGTNWTNGLPSVEKTIVFNGNYPSLSTLNACSCSVGIGKTVTVLNGNTLGLIFDYSGDGILILENNAALYQTEDEIVNTGIIHLKRETTPIFKSDYTYWSSPVSNQRLVDVSPNTSWDGFYSFDANIDDWTSETITNVMVKATGYIIRGPESYSSTNQTIFETIFSGVPNNGIISIPTATTNTSSLLGNPYPSALDADVFLSVNAGIVDGTIYLWTHNTPITNNVYTSDDYAVYNILGGVGTRSATNSGVNNTKPDGKIASGQAFFITNINGGGTVIFNNSMRIVGQNSNFFKPSSIEKSKVLEGLGKHRIWLNLSNNQGAFKQTLIGYITGATNDFDRAFDGESFNANEYVDFYSVNQDKNLVIQGRTLPFDENDEVRLGFRTIIDGTFVINIDETDGLLINQAVFIEDKLTNTVFNLKNGNYTFNTVAGTFNDRFVLRYMNKKLGIGNFDTPENRVLVSNNNECIKINSLTERIDKVTIYDLLGRQIYKKNKVNSNGLLIFDLLSINQKLLVKVILENSKIVTKKIIH